MKNAFYILLIVAVLKLLINSWRYYRIVKLYGIYTSWVESLLSGGKAPNNFMDIKPEAVDLFYKSKITKPVTPYNEPIGYGKVISGNLDSWDNMFVNNQHIILSVNQSFKEAKSTFKFRIKQAINPVYWFEIILLFPEYIVKYFGYNSDNFIIKFLNLIWWLFGGFYAIYADKINPFIQDFLSNVFK